MSVIGAPSMKGQMLVLGGELGLVCPLAIDSTRTVASTTISRPESGFHVARKAPASVFESSTIRSAPSAVVDLAASPPTAFHP